MDRQHALVIGGLGVIGRKLIEYLGRETDWRITGLSRRSPDFENRAQFIAVDLLDRDETAAKLAPLTDITHIFYCAFQARPTWAEHNQPNLAMLVNAVEPIARASSRLQHVNLVEGTKYYGCHLGPFKTPAKEDDPPHMLPNFYYNQEQWLRRFQNGKSWTWSALRPHAVCGFALGNPMNLALVIAVYAAISRELGLPLRFPGKAGAFTALYQVIDAELLAKAMLWASTAKEARNKAFNVTNGDYFRWCHLWPKFAAFFRMPLGEVQTIQLAEFMADKGLLWAAMQKKYGLMPYRYEDLAAWPFGDYVFGCDWDIMSDTQKIRRHGFADCIDSEGMFLRLFGEFAADAVIPKFD